MATASITGGSRGRGEVYARELAGRAYSIVLVARNVGRLAAAERIARATGAAVETISADLADPAGLAVVERRGVDPDRPVDLLVKQRRHGVPRGVRRRPGRGPRPEIALNVTAPMRLTRAAVPVMAARGRGGVVNVAGFAGYLPSGGNPYGASKAWVLAFTDTVAASLAGTGVGVTAVAAGRIRSRGDPEGPLWPDPRTVVRRSLADLRRGRTLCTPGLPYRAVVGLLEAPRRALRLTARLAGRGRERCARLRGDDVGTGYSGPAGAARLPSGSIRCPAAGEIGAGPRYRVVEAAARGCAVVSRTTGRGFVVLVWGSRSGGSRRPMRASTVSRACFLMSCRTDVRSIPG